MMRDIFSRFCRLPSRWALRSILSGRARINSGLIFGMCLICGENGPRILHVHTVVSGKQLSNLARALTNARHLTAACGAVDVVLAPYFRARYPCAAHLVDRRVLKPFATTLVYVERTQSGLHFVTRIPDANAMRIWQRNDAQAP